MVGQSHTLLEKFDLMHNVIAFVKDESNNLMSMVITWPLKLQWIYEGTCFGHIMFKAC
jgi:hypothetical protein